jgi:hypothetical protein
MKPIGSVLITMLALALPGSALAAPKASGAVKTHIGVMQTVMTNRSGQIAQIYIKTSGTSKSERVVGCNARLADQPLLVWAFQNKRLVYLTVDGSNCFSNIDIKI